MIVPLTISNSEIQCYKRCRRKWWMTYYRKLLPIKYEYTGPRSIGNRVHGCVAYYYEAQATVSTDKSVALALALHDWSIALDVDRCSDEQEPEIRKEADLSRAMLEGYFEWLETGVDEGMTVVGIEEEVEKTIETPLTHTPVRLRAKLDLRVAFEGAGDTETLFLDHKTVQEFTTPVRVLHLDEQVLMYNWLLLWFPDLPGGRVSGAVYNMIRKVKRSKTAKPPFFERFTVRHTKQELRTFHTRLMGELEDIIRTRTLLDEGADPMFVAYPTPTRDCSWQCDHFAVCGLLNRPDDKPELMISRLYVEGDPYARYTGEGTIE